MAYQLGYMGVYWYTTTQINNYWKEKIQYQGPKKEIMLPISLPYWVDNEGYRSTDGKITLDGITYRKIFQKYEGDSIYLVLVPDVRTIKAESAIASWVNMLADEEGSEAGSLRLLVSSAKDYLLDSEITLDRIQEEKFRFKPYLQGIFVSPILLPDTPPPNQWA